MKKTNRVTLWSVDYTGIGYNGIYRMFFKTKKEADVFSLRDYSGEPVKRTYTAENAAKYIEEWNDLCVERF